MTRNILCSAVLMVLAGCAVGPDYQPPSQVVNQQSLSTVAGTSDAAPEQQWWQRFDDPMLDSLMERALQDNYSVRAAQQRVKLAESYRSAVSATQLPQIGLGIGVSQFGLSKNGPLGGPLQTPVVLPGMGNMGTLSDRNVELFHAGVGVAWEPDVFGKTASLVAATDARAEQVAIIADGTRLMVLSAVADNYLQLRSTQAIQAELQEQLKDLDAIEYRVSGLVASGLAPDTQLDRVKAQRAGVDAMMPQLQTLVEVHSRRLAILLGDTPDALMAQLSEPRALPAVTGVIPVGLPSELLTRRPDIRFAERQMKVTNAQLGAAIANHYPSFYLTGTPGLASSDFGDLFDGDSTAWTMGAGMNWSLYDGGLRKAMQSVAESQAEIAALDYQSTVNQAFGEVESLLGAYGHSQQRVDALEVARDANADAVTRTRALSDSGMAGSLDVLEAKAALHQAEIALVQARTQHAKLVVVLYKSLGGSWTTDPVNGEEVAMADDAAEKARG